MTNIPWLSTIINNSINKTKMVNPNRITSINVVNVNNDWICFNKVILGDGDCIKKFKSISIRIVIKNSDVKRIIVRSGIIIIVCKWES
jgi:hypothetical protein